MNFAVNSVKNAIEFCNITKKFGDFFANDNISFSVKKGSITALLGENGAGKSTAMKILYGLYKQDAGDLFLFGKKQNFSSPRDAISHRVGMVHQHFMLSDEATALDNILLGYEHKFLKFPYLSENFNLIDRRKAREKIEGIFEKYGLTVPLDVPLRELSVGMHQRIEIVKLLFRDAEILILDEPTAVLTPPEADVLFKNLQLLKKENKTIIVVTHKLREVLNFTDEITVFRSGKVVGCNIPTNATNEESISNLMVGRNVVLQRDLQPYTRDKKVLLQFENLNLKSKEQKKSQKLNLENINFSISKGEIVGIAGIEGNGQEKILDVIFHPQKFFSQERATGSLFFADKKINQLNNAQVRKLKIGLIPDDRIKNGLLLKMRAIDSYLLGRQREKKFHSGIFLNYKKILHFLKKDFITFDVKPNNPHLLSRFFSGGNQQKIIIARELGKNPSLLIASNPTRGVDIGAIEFIHSQIIEQRNKGTGVLLISSELDEILALSDRVLVMLDGKIVAEFKRDEADEKRIGLAMCGAV